MQPVRALQSTGKSKACFTWHYAFVKNSLEFVAIIAVTRYDLDKFYDDIQKDLEEGKYAPGVTSYFEKKAQGEDE